MAGGKITKAAITLAKVCHETLFEDGVKAFLAVQKNVVAEAVENIVEANTLLSGIGFESGSLAAAHAIQMDFNVIEDTQEVTMGLVAFVPSRNWF